KSINDRLDGSILEIKKSYNKVIVHDEWLRGIMEERFLSSLEYIRRGSKEGYYSLDERKEIIARFSEENEKIARYFLGRDNGILFSDEIIDVPMHTDNINVNDIISIFTYIMLQQEREINELKKELYETEWLNIVQKNRKDRELILFGAGYICDRFLSSCLLDVQYVVDNNKTKSGSYIHGIPIVHTADIDQWSEYYVIITCGAYVDIEKQLETYGLKKESDYFTYTDNLSV
ncbi:MAG: hypothetical protein Q4D29_05170, partial [Lachnospiraceae bacterium]|nr:hypothetical protein [Lachnospiraceae bacterium]